MLLLYLWYAHNPIDGMDKRMFIFVPQEDLRAQTERIFNAHKLEQLKFTVVPLATLDLCNRYPDAYYLLDEADMFIKQHLIEYKNKARTGLNALRNMKAFLFTATLPEFWQLCVRYLFEAPQTCIIEVKTVQVVFTAQSNTWDIRG